MSEAFDIVVVGTGAAGLSAALSAQANGAKVLVVEKASVVGGTTAMSGGCIWAPRHHYTKQMGVSDSREAVLDYIRAVAPDGWHNREEPLWTAFVDYVYEYDILDNQIEMSEEASDSEDLVTRYRYDPNENQVLVIQPEGNAASSVYDERDLLFQSTRGATLPPPLVHLAVGDPVAASIQAPS